MGRATRVLPREPGGGLDCALESLAVANLRTVKIHLAWLLLPLLPLLDQYQWLSSDQNTHAHAHTHLLSLSILIMVTQQ